MKICFPLKKSDPTNIVEPIVKYLELSESPQVAMSFRENLQKINALRDKVCNLELPPNPQISQVDKYIAAVEMYAKYALTLAKHLNWNKDYGMTVSDLKLTWHDSFNYAATFTRSEIHFDIFCCFYNIAVMYLYKANILCMDFLDGSKKESIKAAKISFYLFNKMRVEYYPSFQNTGFADTNHSMLETLQLLSQGIIYKNLFNLFKSEQYKFGINNIASIAGEAQKRFFNAYQIASQYFMKSPHIGTNIKSQLLSFAYLQALYHDAMFNTKYAKYYKNEMDNNHDNIIYLLAYERKAMRFLELGLKNQSVRHLMDARPEQKKELENILPEIKESLNENILRNEKIYKKKEIREQDIPPPMETPKKYIAEPVEPEKIKIDYENPIAAPFAKLADNQSKAFMMQLKEFGQNRLLGLETAKTKLLKTIQSLYNDNYVNYYLNLESKNQNKSLPQNLKQKIKLISDNGGKKKLDLQIQIIKKNDQQIMSRFKEMSEMLRKQEQFDKQKRNQYQNKWNRPPSQDVNKGYKNQIQVYSSKAQQASVVNQRIIEKYHNLEKYINVVDESDETIMKALPKVQLAKFLEENTGEFARLRQGVTSVKAHQENLQNTADDIRRFLDKLNYKEQAGKFSKELQTTQGGYKQQIFEKIFGEAYQQIAKFNQIAKTLQDEAKQVAQVSNNLNKKNKGDQKNKKEFEDVLSKFNEINNLFRQVAQGTGFYTKINEILAKILTDLQGFLAARQLQAQELQTSIKKGGFGAGGNLPSLYPNQAPQQNLGFYIPPAMTFNNLPSQMGYNPHMMQQNQNHDMSSMLQDIMNSKPNFGGDIFKGPVYQSVYKHP